MIALVINSSQKIQLRKQTHHLKTVVTINERSTEEAIFPEIDRQLKAHELIKIRIGEKDPDIRAQWANRICESLECALIQHIGQTLFFYRPLSQEVTEPTAKKARYGSPDEYIPKKLAAVGKTLKPFKKRKIASPSLDDSPRARYLDGFESDRPARPTTHRKKSIASFGKTSGGGNKRSAFSLRTNRRK